MPFNEYTKWDGSQQFQPQSAEKAFDQISEYLMQYGDQVLRNLDDIADEDMKDLVELIQKEGFIEEDGEGKVSSEPEGAPPGPGIGPHQPVSDLPAGRDRQARDARRRGTGRSVMRTRSPTSSATRSSNLNMHETLKNAMARQGGGYPIRLRHDDYVVHEVEHQTRCATVVLIDMSGSMSRYGKYATTKKVALALQAMVRAQYARRTRSRWSGFYSFASVMTERELLELSPQAGEPV